MIVSIVRSVCGRNMYLSPSSSNNERIIRRGKAVFNHPSIYALLFLLIYISSVFFLRSSPFCGGGRHSFNGSSFDGGDGGEGILPAFCFQNETYFATVTGTASPYLLVLCSHPRNPNEQLKYTNAFVLNWKFSKLIGHFSKSEIEDFLKFDRFCFSYFSHCSRISSLVKIQFRRNDEVCVWKITIHGFKLCLTKNKRFGSCSLNGYPLSYREADNIFNILELLFLPSPRV